MESGANGEQPRTGPTIGRRRLIVGAGATAVAIVVADRVQGSTDKASDVSTGGGARHRSPHDPPAVDGAAAAPGAGHVFDLVVAGGRVIDPETGYDATADVGIDGRTITAIDPRGLQGKRRIDARNLVVAPGFIDIISYEPNSYGIWYKVADGVTTNLGMHGMLTTASRFFTQYAGASPCHYGGAYDDLFMRGDGDLQLGSGSSATSSQVDRLADEAEQQLHDGWIGVSFSPEYTPGITAAEIDAVAAVAAKHGVPCFFHARYATDVPPDDNAKALSEILGVAQRTGAAVHVMHITSTGGTFQMPTALDTLSQAQANGTDVTCCMYPYSFWATYLGSPRFSDGWQDRFHISYDDLVIPGTGERLTASSFARYRAENKLAAAYAIPEQDVTTGLSSPLTMIGSDSILEHGDNNHPRGAGCFSRTLGHYVRETGTLSLVDALKKMTIMPAKRLEAKAPALRLKGRLQRGADADITVFDPATIIDRSTVDEPAQEAVGISYVLVVGQVVRDLTGNLDHVLPGEPIKSQLS